VDPIIVTQSSRIHLPAATVWDRVTSPSGIRHELRPVLSMTMPPGLRGRSISEVGDLLGRPLGKAWLLLLGVVPVEYDDMVLVEVVDGRSFHERSRMATLARWEHERTVLPVEPDSCEVADRLVFVPRVLADRVVVRRVVQGLVSALFAHRHRRLRRWAERLRGRGRGR
jgi:hypothetical protein